MNDTPQPQKNWSVAFGNRGRDTEAFLHGLQTRNRLAVHTFENGDKIHPYPAGLQKDLAHNIPYFSGVRGGVLREGEVAVFSMSLLPSRATGKSIEPFAMSRQGTTVGYLFSLDEFGRDPARVVRVMGNSPKTGNCNFRKDFRITGDCRAAVEHLREVHQARHPESGLLSCEDALLNEAFTHAARSSRQLDLLARSFSQKEDAVLPLNQILVAAAPAHVEAIVVPLSHDLLRSGELYRMHAQLKGALAALAHQKKKADLPLVSYDIDGPQRGKIAFLAQGRSDCRTLALEAMDAMQKSGHLPELAADKESCFAKTVADAHKFLAVNFQMPLRQQGVSVPAQGRFA